MPLPQLNNVAVAPRLIKPIDYSNLNKAFEVLDQRHIAALSQRSKIAEDIATKYELDPSEEGWKADFTNEMLSRIDNIVDNNSGYAGNALSESIKVAGDFVMDPRLRYRVRANQERNKRKDLVNAMVASGQISPEIAQQWDEENPYFYTDIYEGETQESAIDREIKGIPGQGKIVAGTTWKPSYMPVKTINTNELFDKAIEDVVKNAPNRVSDKLYYKRSDGSYTDVASEADPLNPYPWYKTTEGISQVTKEQLRMAMLAAINSTPGARESIEQDLSNGLWRTAKLGRKEGATYLDKEGNIIDNAYTDDHGLALSPEMYIESMIDPKARTMAKVNSTKTITSMEGIQFDMNYRMQLLKEEADLAKQQLKEEADLAKQQLKGYGKGNGSGSSTKSLLYDRRLGLYGVPSVGKRIEVQGLLANQQIMDEAANNIIELAETSGVVISPDDTIETIWEKIDKNYFINDPNLREEVFNMYDNYIYTKKLIEDNLSFNENPDAAQIIDAMRLVSAANGKYSVSKNNVYRQTYDKAINNFFQVDGKTVDEIYIPTTWANHKFYNIINSIKQEFGDNIFVDNDSYIKVNRANRAIIPKLIQLMDGVEDTTGHNTFGTGISKGPSGTTTHTMHFNTMIKNSKGKYELVNTGGIISAYNSNRYVDSLNEVLNDAKSRIKKLEDGEDNQLAYSIVNTPQGIKYFMDYATVPTEFVPFESFGNALTAQGADKSEIDAHIQNWKSSMSGYIPKDGNKLFVGIGGKDAIEIKDLDQKRIIWNAIASDEYFIKNSVYGYDPLTYDPRIHINTYSSLSEKTKSQISKIIQELAEEAGIDLDDVNYRLEQPLDIIIPNVDDKDDIKKMAMSTPEYKGNSLIAQYNAARTYNVPLSDNVSINIKNRTLSISGGTPIPLSQISYDTTDNGYIPVEDIDAGTRGAVAARSELVTAQRNFATGKITENQFREDLNDFISSILNDKKESVNVKTVVNKIIEDTKHHYRIK